jgi:hypothetical protein
MTKKKQSHGTIDHHGNNSDNSPLQQFALDKNAYWNITATGSQTINNSNPSLQCKAKTAAQHLADRTQTYNMMTAAMITATRQSSDIKKIKWYKNIKWYKKITLKWKSMHK